MELPGYCVMVIVDEWSMKFGVRALMYKSELLVMVILAIIGEYSRQRMSLRALEPGGL